MFSSFIFSLLFCRKAREDEKAASQRLTEMVANYGDVIPRREFEQLTKDFTKLQEDFEQKVGDFSQLQEEHECVHVFHATCCWRTSCDELLSSSTFNEIFL